MRRRSRRGCRAGIAARPGARSGARAQPRDRGGRNAPIRALGGPAGGERRSLPRSRALAGVRGPTGARVRDARARGHGRPRGGDLRRQRAAPPHPPANRAVGQLAAVARGADRPDVQPRADLQGLSTRGPAASIRGLGGLRAPRGDAQRERRDRGLHVPVVRRAAAPAPRHDRDPGDGLADSSGAHDRAERVSDLAREAPHGGVRSGVPLARSALGGARREPLAGCPPRPGGRARGPCLGRPHGREGVDRVAARAHRPSRQRARVRAGA